MPPKKKKKAPGVTVKQHRAEKQRQRTIDQSIKQIEYKPAGFLTSSEFSVKAGVSPAAITLARQAGAFSVNNMRWVKLEGKRKSLYIHWDSEGPGFIRNRPVDKWPDWFVDENEIQQLNEDHDPTHPKHRDTGSGIAAPMGTVVVTDLNSAKLREKQLAIRAKELELQKANNEVIGLHEVAELLTEIAINTRQTLLAIGPKVAPLLAAERTHRGCLDILQKEIEKALTGLSKLGEFTKGKTNGNG